jgi:hypothetical protein
VYTADGGHAEEFAERGVNHFWMPPGMSDEGLGLATPPVRCRFKKRYVFVGSNSKGIHGDHRSQLISWCKKTYKAGFQHYGTGSYNKVYGDDLGYVYAVARVAFGDSAPADYYWSDRVPTTMGRGGVLAYPRTPGLEQHGYDDSNMILYDRYDFNQLGARIDNMQQKEFDSMREAAITVTSERHMWRHRLLQIKEEVLG